jgi:2-dehydro-3-deoxygalactonokinase
MDAPAQREFLSCDWGTTSFRLRWIAEGKILREHFDQTGCKALFDSAGKNRAEAFEAHLHKTIAAFQLPAGKTLPLIVSGMASSTIGWRELPYAHLPFRLDGTDLRVERIKWNSPAQIAQTLLVSGAATESEMMRGEETEAIGLLAALTNKITDARLILPGTHSKHLTIQSGKMFSIRTFMTGELYDVLTQHTVLRASVTQGAAFDSAAFTLGIDCAAEHGLAGALFQTRTRQVLQQLPPEANASFLSGILIGDELRTINSAAQPNVFIAGANTIRESYAHAARHLGIPAHVFSAEEVRLAVPRAHALILSRFAK